MKRHASDQPAHGRNESNATWGMPFTLHRAKPAHTQAAGRFQGNRNQRRAQAAIERRAIRRIKTIGVTPDAVVSGGGTPSA